MFKPKFEKHAREAMEIAGSPSAGRDCLGLVSYPKALELTSQLLTCRENTLTYALSLLESRLLGDRVQQDYLEALQDLGTAIDITLHWLSEGEANG